MESEMRGVGTVGCVGQLFLFQYFKRGLHSLIYI